MTLKVNRPEKLVEVCLNGALVAEYEAVEAELKAKRQERVVDKRMNDPILELEKKKAELWGAQREDTVVFRLRGLPRATWSKLKLDNPPRKDDEVDQHYGFNIDAIFDKAMGYEDEDPSRNAIVSVTKNGEPVEFKPTDWADFAADLTDAQYNEFCVALNSLNGGRLEVPFSPTGYKMIQDSDANSK